LAELGIEKAADPLQIQQLDEFFLDDVNPRQGD